MSDKVRHSGWFSTTDKELQSGTFVTTESEFLQNVFHYYQQATTTVPVATVVYMSIMINGVPHFIRATNMPHSEDIIRRILTPYCKQTTDEINASIGTHGHGGSVPFIYTGGVLTIQYEDSGTLKQVVVDVEQQRLHSKSNHAQDEFPTPTYSPKISSTHRRWKQSWSPEIMRQFEPLGLCTFFVHEEPNFKGHVDLVQNQTDFANALEGIQAEFEELIVDGKLRVIGLFVKSDDEIIRYDLPYDFFSTHTFDNGTPIQVKEGDPLPLSPFGITDLENKFTFDFFCHTDKLFFRFGELYGEVTGTTNTANWKPLDNAHVLGLNRQPDFTVTCGRITETCERLCRWFVPTSQNHCLKFPRLEEYAHDCYVNIRGYRTTLKPIEDGMIKVSNKPYKSRTRVLVDIQSDEVKRKYFNATAWKDRSCFPQNNRDNNPILRAMRTVYGVFNEWKSAEPVTVTLDMVVQRLGSKEESRQKVHEASVSGLNFEQRCGHALHEKYSDNYQVTVGDALVRNTLLETQSKEYLGVDIAIVNDDVALMIQCKDKERISEEDVISFIRTFKRAMEIHRTQRIVCGIFVSRSDVSCKKARSLLLETPGITGVVVGTNVNILLAHVDTVLSYYN